MYQVICIGYGHGGIINSLYQTRGKQYHHQNELGQTILSFYEGVFNRQVAAKLINELLAEGYVVYDVVAGRYITSTITPELLEQRDVSLSTRVRRANAIANSLYISIHGNAVGNNNHGPSLAAKGFAAFTSEGQTTSDKVAEDICAGVNTHTKFHVRKEQAVDGDSDFERQFYVLTQTRGPAVLLEAGFFTNLEEAKYMQSPCGQYQITAGIMTALRKWLKHPTAV